MPATTIIFHRWCCLNEIPVVTAEKKEMTKKTHQFPPPYKQTKIIYCLWCQNKFPHKFPFTHLYWQQNTVSIISTKSRKWKVDVRHTGIGIQRVNGWGAHGYPQFTCPWERIQAWKEAHLGCKTFDTGPGTCKCSLRPCVGVQLLLSVPLSAHPVQISEASTNPIHLVYT